MVCRFATARPTRCDFGSVRYRPRSAFMTFDEVVDCETLISENWFCASARCGNGSPHLVSMAEAKSSDTSTLPFHAANRGSL